MDIIKSVSELRPGDLVDLEGDKFADPRRDKLELQTEYQTVDYTERETPTCIAIGFTGFDVIGFPPDHAVKVAPCRATQIAAPREFSKTELELAASLACYCSNDDWAEDRRAFLLNVRERIDMDLQTGEY